MPREHGESGEYVETVTLDDVLDTFDHVEGPVVLSADVADRLGCSRETARRKLEALHDRGDLARRKVSRRVIYWRPESGRESAVTPSPTPADRTPSTPTDGVQDVPSDAEDAVDALDLPGSGGKLDARRDAIRGMYDMLRDHAGDPVGKAALLTLVDADAVGYASDGSFWTNCVKANASAGREHALVALPGVEDWGGGEYRYTPPEDDDT